MMKTMSEVHRGWYNFPLQYKMTWWKKNQFFTWKNDKNKENIYIYIYISVRMDNYKKL